MIDIANEQLISLAEAAEMLPSGRKGRHPNVKTIYAYTRNGCRGVVLSSAQAGAKRVTSKEAVQRFIQELTAAAGTARSTSCRRATATRDADIDDELDRLGVR